MATDDTPPGSGRDEPSSSPATDDRADYDYRANEIHRPAVRDDLEELVSGEVRFDEYSRALYATDASAYELLPIGVVFPTSTADVSAVVSYCNENSLAVLPRGGGTSLAGQTVNRAVVLDFTRYMDEVLTLDPAHRRARVQPGTIVAALNQTAAEHDLKFAPDPSTANRSTIGGAIGNNTTGAHSLKYGKTDAYIDELEVVLADGTVTTFGEIHPDTVRQRANSDGDLESRLYAEVCRILDQEREAVEAAYPSIKRNVSGYNLDVIVEQAKAVEAGERETLNLAKLIVGSEGTLAVITEATVSLEPLPGTKAIGLLTYDSLIDAMEDVGPILEHDPAAVEVLDGVLLDLARDLDEFAEVVGVLPERTDTFLLVEFYGDTTEVVEAAVEGLLSDRVGEIAFDGLRAFEAAEQERFWQMRKASTPILLSRTTDEKHIAFIEDIAVPPENLPEYIADFQQVFEDHDTVGSFYAHAGPGCIHVRPLVNTKTEAGVEQMESLADAATDLAVRYGGSVSGEHGDGRARTQWNRKLYGQQLWETFRSLKTAVDPDWLLNPGPVCGDVDMTENLRFDPEYEFDAGFESTLSWENDNGFQGMAELCHGCGGCRGTQDTTGGVMCPTYRAADEEITSTRGRANLLRQAMSGNLEDEEQFDVEFMHEVLDLCVGCKGCARECPSEVDMAKMKVEVDNEYQQRHGTSIRTRVFSNIDRLADLGSTLAPLSNVAQKLPGAGELLERGLGIASERSLPTFERETLVDWFEARGGSTIASDEADRRVLLFPDTYTNHTHPQAGRAAVRVLEAANVTVDLATDIRGSGRPAYSKGLVDAARERAKTNVAALAPAVRDGWDVVVVEPTDAVMLQSDYLDLLGGDANVGSAIASDAETVAANTYGVCEYFDTYELDDRVAFEGEGYLTYHGHCHQKAMAKDHHAVGLLRRAGYRVDALDSGCCGMAGSFGYEAEHYSMSQAIGRLLFDQIDVSDGDSVVAPGTSCRAQIGDEYGSEPPHPVERLEAALV